MCSEKPSRHWFCLMPPSHLHMKAHPVRATYKDNFHKIERDVTIMWQLRGLCGCYSLCGCYRVYIPLSLISPSGLLRDRFMWRCGHGIKVAAPLFKSEIRLCAKQLSSKCMSQSDERKITSVPDSAFVPFRWACSLIFSFKEIAATL